MIPKLGMLLASVTLALVLAEWWAPDAHVYVHLRHGGLETPYLPDSEADLVTPEFSVRYRINALGFRDAPRRVAKPPGTRRVLVLGDSHAAGWGVEQNETFAARLEAHLGAEVEVWNTAKHAGCAVWYVLQARDFRERFDPDLLVVQLFDNDPSDSATLEERFPRDEDGRLLEVPDRYRWETGVAAGVSRWWRHLSLVNRWKRLRKRLDGETLPAHQFFEPGIWGRRIAGSAGTAAPEGGDGDIPPAQLGFRPHDLAFHEALIEQLLGERGELPIVLLYVPARPRLAGTSLENVRANNPLYQGVADAAGRAGTPLVDLQEVFLTADVDPRDFYFQVDGHINALGHAAAADALREPVLAALAGAPPP